MFESGEPGHEEENRQADVRDERINKELNVAVRNQMVQEILENQKNDDEIEII